tara:strand:+ start:272 stop:649 length:378 start_codon:yes stop_codon:yes gene_type:complete
MSVPDTLKYTKDHEWVREEAGLYVVGITHHAQEQLGDVVFAELPEVGDTITADESFGTVESVKAVSDLFAPMTGEVVEVNGALEDAPETVNSEPYEGGWMIKLKTDDTAQFDDLMSASDYSAHIA